MTGPLGQESRSRISRSGLAPISDEVGAGLFDAAVATDQPALVPVRLDKSALRTQAANGVLPPILKTLVRVPVKRATTQAATAAQGPTLAQRLRTVPESEHHAVAVELVRADLAAVLGYRSAAGIDPQQQFQDIGIDSLTAVELRNRLNGATGLRLAASLVFDYPTPDALAGHILAELALTGDLGAAPAAPDDAEIRRTIGSIPLDRLRAHGLLDTLLKLAADPGEPEAAPENESDGPSIASMDLDDLVRMALGGDDDDTEGSDA
jgi:polyketide synthase 12